ncbi:hypothetical protein C0J52_28002 [Blattella germanica]|nr:hypothetical protein C0J52_28002 [Blattella germanica]
MLDQQRLPCAIKLEKDLKSSSYDGIVLVVTPEFINSQPDILTEPIKTRAKVTLSSFFYVLESL